MAETRTLTRRQQRRQELATRHEIRQTHLTDKQAKKFYAEYLAGKETTYTGEVYDFYLWKKSVEEILDREVGIGSQWSNTQIRKAIRQISKSGKSWSSHQINILVENVTHPKNDSQINLSLALMEEFGVSLDELGNFIRSHAPMVYRFIEAYDGDWNQYFNS